MAQQIGFVFFPREYDDTYNKIQLLSKMISVVQTTNQYRNKEKVSLWRDKQRNEVTEYLRKKMETFSTLKKKDDLIVTELLKNVKELRINYT